MSRIINLSDPPLANGYLVSGVANFYTSTKPTARVDGSALVIGDIWINPSNGNEWFWNGTYWLSGLQSCSSMATWVASSTFFAAACPVNVGAGVYIYNVRLRQAANSAFDLSNYLVLNSMGLATAADIVPSPTNMTTNTIGSSGVQIGGININNLNTAFLYATASTNTIRGLYRVTTGATVGSLTLSGNLSIQTDYSFISA